MYEKTKLDNGLTIITQNIPGVESATVLVLVGAGSRYENKQNNGIAHFLEHIFFKGGEKYKSSEEVAKAIDAVGGEFNAFTGKEYVGYYVKVAATHIERAYDVLSDMLLKPSFSPEDLERERGVILQEYEMYQDMPVYQVGWDFENALFGDQPLGWDQIGKKEFIAKVTKAEMLKFRNQLYTPENCVIAVAGAVAHDTVVKNIQKYFKFGKENKNLAWQKFDGKIAHERVHIHAKKTEQAHLILGVRGLDTFAERKQVQAVLAAILGGGMSSRMFLNVREKRGLCYSIHTSADTYVDTGTFSTYAGVPPQRFAEAVTAILAEYRKITEESVGTEELSKAKEFLKGKLTLSLEDSEQVAHSLGSQELLKRAIKTPAEIKAKIDAVTAEEVRDLALELFTPDQICLTVIGPFEGKEAEFTKLLNF